VGLQDGEIIDLGKRKLQVISSPGHSEDDIILLDAENGIVFSGDTLLNWDTTFMSLW